MVFGRRTGSRIASVVIEAPLDSLEKVHEARAWINTEDPRWWLEPGDGGIVWMPSEFWGLSDD